MYFFSLYNALYDSGACATGADQIFICFDQTKSIAPNNFNPRTCHISYNPTDSFEKATLSSFDHNLISIAANESELIYLKKNKFWLDLILACGGTYPSHNYCETYDIQTKKWKTITPYPFELGSVTFFSTWVRCLIPFKWRFYFGIFCSLF